MASNLQELWSVACQLKIITSAVVEIVVLEA